MEITPEKMLAIWQLADGQPGNLKHFRQYETIQIKSLVDRALLIQQDLSPLTNHKPTQEISETRKDIETLMRDAGQLSTDLRNAIPQHDFYRGSGEARACAMYMIELLDNVSGEKRKPTLEVHFLPSTTPPELHGNVVIPFKNPHDYFIKGSTLVRTLPYWPPASKSA